MKATEVVSKAETFALDYISKLKDPNETIERKQVFFLDNQENLTKYMEALKKVIASLESEDGTMTVEDNDVIVNAKDIITQLKEAVNSFKNELTVKPDLTEEDTTVVFDENTIQEAMKTNKTTQEISANMNAIAEQQKTASIGYNYALVCDGQLNMISATDKQTLNDAINSIANAGNYKNIQLYKIQYVPVQLHQKTVLSV